MANPTPTQVPDMHFAPADEQLEYLQKGAAEIIRVPDLRERLEASRKTGHLCGSKRGLTQLRPIYTWATRC